MPAEKEFTEQESLQLITEMILKAKHSFHESGTSAILWGSVIGIAGLLSFAERFWNFYIGFDIWLIVSAAIIPQIFISIKEVRSRKVLTYQESSMDAIGLAFGLSVFALIFFLNVVPGVSDKIFAADQKELFIKDLTTGEMKHYVPAIMSGNSLLLLLYAFQSMAIGIACKYRPMLIGGILCFGYFIISCFTISMYDLLLNGIAGITCWLIPGLILRFRYQSALTNV